VDWKKTLNLPKTEFAMRADLAKREPAWLERWAREGQYEKLLAERKAAGAPEFVLHDGPPYPTGAIHYGTLLNKVLKDIVVRSQLAMGKRAVFRPGWDCHGLPIEHQVEKELGKDAKALDTAAFRKSCEAHALKYVDVMRGEFKRLGCVGRWEDPYLTLSPDYEATIVRQLAEFARRGLIYRDKKPVHWCLVHKTALAEAEVEYEEHSSPSIYVRLPLVEGTGKAVPRLEGKKVALVIWTTTPWTLPANLAVVANSELDYVAIPRGDEYLIVAQGRAEAFLKETGIAADASTWIPISRAELRALEKVRYEAPYPLGEKLGTGLYRLFFARHATLEAGTGLVHTAPGHGAEDYGVGREHKLPIYAPVAANGALEDSISPLAAKFVGMNVFKANPEIVADLAARGLLLNKPGETLKHSYPVCWRCKNPIIFRATEQWFARLGEADDPSSLRHEALREIGETRWIPAWGENRIRGMIEARPDWCLSRQRVWGVPIPAFRCASCRNDLLSAEVMDHVAGIFAREGSNAWFSRPAAELLPSPAPRCGNCGKSEWEQQHDIVDVWFESGVSWAAVAEGHLVGKDQKVDLYLEGADQHRGWFHSSLLTSAATRRHAPYKAVLTHGWVLDERGKVYSKSDIAKARAAGVKIDYVDPIVWMQKNGAELLRLWTAASDYQGDIVFSQTILDQLGETYRKIRNSCRFLLSNLYDFSPSRDTLVDSDLRELDILALGLLRERDQQIWDAYKRFAFHEVIRLMNDYVITASSEYFDPIKDVLYCEATGSRSRRSVQTAVCEMVRTIAQWMAPVLCFTAQDVADELGRATGEAFDVHGAVRLVDEGEKMGNPNKRWTDEVRPRREAILQPLEKFRAAGHKPLEARVRVKPARDERPHWQWNLGLLTELAGVSRLELDAADAAGPTEITIDEAPGPECPRCWRRTGEAAGPASEPNLCARCAAVVAALPPESLPTPGAAS
jgi:isoleucyl-tRNA synthetase